MMPINIAEQLGVHKSSVTKISNAMKKSQSLATPYIPHLKKKLAATSSVMENFTEVE